MKFCIALAYNDPLELAELARCAEASGFAAVVLSDHLVYPAELRTPYPYTRDGAPRWQPSTPWPDPLVTAAALAAATERLQFIVSVYVLPLRHPAHAAKAAATAAVLSRNRLVLGVGAGWMREEFDLVGEPFAGRGRRLDEAIEVLRRLWSGDAVGFAGEFYRFEPVRMSPVPAAPIPIWGGGVSAPALRRAATLCDGWLSEIQQLDELPAVIAALREQRAASPRHGRELAIAAALADARTLDDYRRAAAAGVTHLITVPWLHYGRGENLQDKVAGIRRFGDEIVAAFGATS